MSKDKETEQEESLHWADQIARKVRDRVEKDPELKKIVDEKGYIVYDEKTPSGNIHIGSGRGWIIHDVIAKAMRNIGLKGRFILSSDDIDPFDKMNKDLPESFRQYLGIPFMNIPSPVEGFKSYADYYFRLATDRFKDFGIEAELESTGERYINGDFDWAIKKVLDNTEIIHSIYEGFYGSRPSKLPFNPICEKCGRIGTTRAIAWHKEEELVEYKCEPELVPWAKGCGHEGKRSPYKGGGKFPWKVEWAAKWAVVGVTCEWAGKDHFTSRGSRDVAIAIADQVFDFMPPYPSTRKYSGKGYEFFTISGKKMSTSKGRGISFSESTEYAPAEILRYLLVATRPRAVLDFDPVEKNDLILLHERFDKTERIYFGAEKEENEHERNKHLRIYELSHIGELPKKLPPQISFMNASMVIQVVLGDVDKAIALLQKTNQVPAELNNDDREYLINRLSFAKKWVDTFAPDRFTFTVMDKPHDDLVLDNKEKKTLSLLSTILKKEKLEDSELHDRFYRICEETGIEAPQFFKAAYRLLINKERGPKLASFIRTIGFEKVISLISQAVEKQ